MCMIIFEVRRGILMRFEARLEWNEFQTKSEKHEKEKFYSRKSSHGLYNFLNNSAKQRLNIYMNVYLAKIELDRVSIWRLISLAPFFRRKLVMRISMLTPSINYHRSKLPSKSKDWVVKGTKILNTILRTLGGTAKGPRIDSNRIALMDDPTIVKNGFQKLNWMRECTLRVSVSCEPNAWFNWLIFFSRTWWSFFMPPSCRHAIK